MSIEIGEFGRPFGQRLAAGIAGAALLLTSAGCDNVEPSPDRSRLGVHVTDNPNVKACEVDNGKIVIVPKSKSSKSPYTTDLSDCLPSNSAQ